MRGAEAALVSRVHRLEHVERLTAANLTDDDPIRPHAKGVPDVRLVLLGALSTLPGTRWHDVRLFRLTENPWIIERLLRNGPTRGAQLFQIAGSCAKYTRTGSSARKRATERAYAS